MVEEQIAGHYRQVEPSTRGLELTGAIVLAELRTNQEDTAWQRTRHEHRLKALEAERLKLLQAHYAAAIPIELLKSEQERISFEVETMRSAVKSSTTAGELAANRGYGVALAKDCYGAYLAPPDQQRRLMNDAFFKKVRVTEDGVVGWEDNQPFATLLRAHGAKEPHLAMSFEPSVQSQADDVFEPQRPRVRVSQKPRPMGQGFCRPVFE